MTKLYNCQLEFCNKSVAIRRIIKQGEYKGKKVCYFCKQKHDSTPKKVTKTAKERKRMRKSLTEYYNIGIKRLVKNPNCQNCGRIINVKLHPINNIAHIFSKQRYKSVMANPYNMLILCDSKDNLDGGSCHREFDNKIKSRPDMPVFNTVLLTYQTFSEGVKEWGIEREVIENELQFN